MRLNEIAKLICLAKTAIVKQNLIANMKGSRSASTRQLWLIELSRIKALRVVL